jgi:acetyltransferase-like isoleucine patch superfamily enzyme
VKSEHNLKELYRVETSYQKYKRVMAGKDATLFSLLLIELLLTTISWIPGLLGIFLRKILYPSIFLELPFTATLNRNVTLRSPGKICIGAHSFVDEYVQIQAISAMKQSIVIGDGCSINSFVILNAGEPEGSITIGARSTIGQGTYIYGNGQVDIGDNVLIAGQCFIVSSSHVYGATDRPISEQGIITAPIRIEDGAWIGAGAKILSGVTIGRGSIVGANSVVTSNVPPMTVVAGIPAKVIKIINEDTP